jgi:predicted nucleic acid-binding protein
MNATPGSDDFVDTNILVYAYDLSAGDKHAAALQLMEGLWAEGTGCLSLQVLQEFFVTVTQKIARPLEHPFARQIIADLAHWRIHTPDTTDLLRAIDLQQECQVSFWDAMILQSASRLGCTQLYSEDFSHGQSYAGVRVVNPFLKE